MPIIAFLPRVVLSAIIVVVAIQHFDPWTVGLVKKLVAGRDTHWKSIIGDLTIVLIVAVTGDCRRPVDRGSSWRGDYHLILPVPDERTVVWRAYHCDAVHSRKTRMPGHMDVLGRHGRRILVLELEGPIFSAARRISLPLSRQRDATRLPT
jgi:hypothetical protein